MSHFAKVDKQTNKVTEIIVATKLHIYSLSDSEDWVQYSYNKSYGKPSAQIGSTYDRENDVFIPPQPIMSTSGAVCASWIWDSLNYKWVPPVPEPKDWDTLYAWVEETQEWIPHYSADDVINDRVPDSYKIAVGILTA
jgi:hypothetical protein